MVVLRHSLYPRGADRQVRGLLFQDPEADAAGRYLDPQHEVEPPEEGWVNSPGRVADPEGGIRVLLQLLVDPGLSRRPVAPDPQSGVLVEGAEHILDLVEENQGAWISPQKALGKLEGPEPSPAVVRVTISVLGGDLEECPYTPLRTTPFSDRTGETSGAGD